MDGYTQTKVEAEQLALRLPSGTRRAGRRTPPGFVYGPRDRTVLPKIIDSLRRRQFRHIGGGQRALNTIYVGNFVEAVFLALEKPRRWGKSTI